MGAKRSVPGRSKSYDELLLEWQKANNPAFLAKLEKKEEERAKALEAKRLKKLEKKKKKDARRLAASGANGANGSGRPSGISKDGSSQAGALAKGAGGFNTAGPHQSEGLDGTATDLFYLGMEESEVEDELQALLSAVRNHTRDERLITVPLIPRRTYHGLYTAQARRILLLRQAFLGGHSASGAGLLSAARGAGSLNGSASSGGSFRQPPIVAGGGWGSGIFASHS